MKKYIKNMAIAEVLSLNEQIEYLPGQIVSKTLVQNSAVSMTLFAFDAHEEISTHQSHGDALVTILDGSGEITIEDQTYTLQAGESIVMPAGKQHAVFAQQAFKMLLIVIFPRNEQQ